MHVYGRDGEVIFDFGEGYNIVVQPQKAETALRQLPVAIHEAELGKIGQARLFTPAASAARSTL